MYLKELKIESKDKVIREIPFHLGTNLIVDETQNKNDIETGNNLGKTTVLALIDYCLGGDPEQIYKDPESNKVIDFVKDYLVNEEILITLKLKRDLLDEKSQEITIERNFLQRTKKVMKINGENLTKNQGKAFEEKLSALIIGERENNKPGIRQIFAHNIRYKDERINNTLKVLNRYTSNVEYETLYLYMFGLPVSDRTYLMKKLKIEQNFKVRLEKKQAKPELELQIDIVKDNIKNLEEKKHNLNINEKYEEELQELNNTKYKISKISSRISELSLRKELLKETENELKQDISDIDLDALRELYSVAKKSVNEIQKTYEQLIEYHNNMILEKIRYITQDLPNLELEIEQNNQNLEKELANEKYLTNKLSSSDTFSDLESIISDLTNNHQKLGELENSLSQIETSEENITKINDDIELLDGNRFTAEFQELLLKQLMKFNKHFKEVSKELYGEEYGITFSIKEDRKTKQKYYAFECFNLNTSSGKKQGEILCFDIAYILFARNEGIPNLDFILNDKKELMHGNQLLKVNDFAWKNNIQLIFSILKDKIPEEINNDKHIVLRLSEKDKLFRIEEHQ
ncbi:DUF2326 domain-containing protein [Bacillus thuringiensis]|uniref:DUF2326 domain-containing protein n=1 Tax=Bacillus TaxID=1386 RepID=UPI0007A09DFF|nr:MULTISPECIES: DUF2326 domain-containing protein [Bacillus]MDA2008278.1 DUF2326 domain-containing protein [Bacillus cereus]KYZ65304.1 hypothetical protein A3782_26020 [Bacillus sp. GZT]PFQ74030.1 DUF2326 domain-containing protein [Bacillus thuringiensis]PGK62851.1 DUF2326 domain-containing protein [Bacillus thuringiensis]PGM32776.1 DUF2326 domain-containing protein [Bacillus thuringiensis]